MRLHGRHNPQWQYLINPVRSEELIGLIDRAAQALGRGIGDLDRELRREKVEEMSAVEASLMLDAQTRYVRPLHFGNEDLLDEVRDQL